MPAAQVINLNPEPRTETTPLEKTLSAFSQRNRENQVQQRESDALSQIYEEYQRDGNNLEKTLMDIQTRPGISPTTRVNTVNQLINFQKHNHELQKDTQKRFEDQRKKEQELEANRRVVADVERRRGLQPGELAAYENDPKMAEQITRPVRGDKKTQASQPIDDDQLKRINHTIETPEFENASPSQKNLMLIRNGVSKENSKAVIDPIVEEAKLDTERSSAINKKQAEADFGFVNEQVDKIPGLVSRQQTLDAAEILNEEGVTGKNWDIAMQKAGLVQYTSDGFREFSSHAKDAVKNQNIKSVIGSQISQMEFGFFRDATINPNFSKEANRRILEKEKLAIRYEKLYSDITKSIVDQNDGVIPPRVQTQVNEEFAKQSEKLSQQLRKTAIEFEAIQNVPKGKVLMYDDKRRPLHVPADQVEKYSKLGASLS